MCVCVFPYTRLRPSDMTHFDNMTPSVSFVDLFEWQLHLLCPFPSVHSNPSHSNALGIRRSRNLLKVLPGLKRLNGEDLPHSVQFAVEQTGRLPASSSRIPLPNSVLGCFPNDEVRIPLLTFLKEFFTRYDSKPRGDNLLPYYTTASQLVLSVSPDKPYPGGQMPYSNSARMDTVAEDGTKLKITLMTARLTPTYFHKSRNLLRLHNESKRKEVVARGSLACASLLDELPATEHPLESLSVDVAFHSSSQMVFTVSGVFYEVHQQSSDTQTEAKIIRKILRCFSRTMILVAPGGHIIQDDFIISNPSPPLCKKYITGVVCKNRSERTSEASSLQALTDGPDGNTQTVLLNELKQRSGMNEAFSRQCLQEYQWNLEAALNAVQTLSSAGKLPPEAFA
ncbi:unnamed protein product [Dicrocoelium dendriticum]|nr:unnamed protein product [Dicrocoelium dendriticum]